MKYVRFWKFFFEKRIFLQGKLFYIWKMDSFFYTLNRFKKLNFLSVRGAVSRLMHCVGLPQFHNYTCFLVDNVTYSSEYMHDYLNHTIFWKICFRFVQNMKLPTYNPAKILTLKYKGRFSQNSRQCSQENDINL